MLKVGTTEVHIDLSPRTIQHVKETRPDYMRFVNVVSQEMQAWLRGSDTDPRTGENRLFTALVALGELSFVAANGYGTDNRPDPFMGIKENVQ